MIIGPGFLTRPLLFWDFWVKMIFTNPRRALPFWAAAPRQVVPCSEERGCALGQGDLGSFWPPASRPATTHFVQQIWVMVMATEESPGQNH
jgi:hypothetical protein